MPVRARSRSDRSIFLRASCWHTCTPGRSPPGATRCASGPIWAPGNWSSRPHDRSGPAGPRVHRVGPGVRQPRPGHATASVAATAATLARWMAARGLVTARPAAAQDANAIVVTSATAARYRLRAVSDLAGVAPGLVFGGPPECAERLDCLPGLRRAYGLRFRAFAALDAGRPADQAGAGIGRHRRGAAVHHRSGHSGGPPGRTGRHPGAAAGRERHPGAPAGHGRPLRRRAARRAGRRVRPAVHVRPHGAERPGRAGRPRPARGGRGLAARSGAHPRASGAGSVRWRHPLVFTPRWRSRWTPRSRSSRDRFWSLPSGGSRAWRSAAGGPGARTGRLCPLPATAGRLTVWCRHGCWEVGWRAAR